MELLTSLLSCLSQSSEAPLWSRTQNLLKISAFRVVSGQCRHLVTSHRDSPSVSGVMDGADCDHLVTSQYNLFRASIQIFVPREIIHDCLIFQDAIKVK